MAAAVQADGTPKAGKDFAALPSPVASSKPTSELIEFFMYQCSHCLDSFESGSGWMPRGISLRRVPAVFNNFQLDYARMYYALEQLNTPAEVHLTVMRAIQVERKPMRSKEEQAAFLSGLGIDAARYVSAWDSIGVAQSAKRATYLTSKFNIIETPAMVINGQYLTSPSMAGDVEAMHKVASYVSAALKTGNKAALAGNAAATSGPSTAEPGATNGSSKTQTSNAGKWPAGVAPGNLYLAKYGPRGFPSVKSTVLISAKTKSEAVSLIESKIREHNGDRQDNYALKLIEVSESETCNGPNWGATVSMNTSNSSNVTVSLCGARTPREAISRASELCTKELGRPCRLGRDGDYHLVVSIGHSGARPWGGLKDGFGGPHLDSFPSPGMSFVALGASTQQSSSTNQYIQSPEDAIAQFGKACGASLYGRDTHSCWITSKNLGCVWNNNGQATQDDSYQRKCVDTKLTANGYLP